MIKDKYTLFSLALLILLIGVMLLNRLYVESGSTQERLVYVFCCAIFSVAGLLNVSLMFDKSKSLMDRTHALARFGMFVLGAAMALFIAVKGL